MTNEPPGGWAYHGTERNSVAKPLGQPRIKRKINPLETPSPETVAYAQSLQKDVLGPDAQTLKEWENLGLELPNLDVMRRYRLGRVREQLAKHDYAGIILYDPLNVRYATDSSNMHVWCLHNAVRYVYIPTDGPITLFDFHGSKHLSAHLSLIDEVRSTTTWYYFGAGPRFEEVCDRWAAELASLILETCGDNKRVAIDRCNHEGVLALEKRGLELFNGEEVMEVARSVKCDDEVRAMRCSLATCEIAVGVMHSHLRPGITENRLWSHLHAENIARGGEWIETRLLASGPRTNPWLQESSSRVIEAGDLVSFDTDLIGPYGYCADISRSWICGGGQATPRQNELYQIALQQIRWNTEILKPGMSFKELTEKAQGLSGEFRAQRYSCLYHGVGLCDEYPAIYHPEEWDTYGYDGVLQPNMTLCVESYVGAVGEPDGVKLEEQVLITDDGVELLSRYPIENWSQ